MNFEKTDQYEGQKLGLFIFDCFMSVVYLVLSVILLFTPLLKGWQVPEGVKIGLGVLFGLYGIFRVSRATKRMIQRNR
ncbi:hypothetical protein FACS1894177_04550 [Bacteroidia bacterium]|nr:hypothetical protein FACS1894177_04550 [Bacteroidia bacterium]